MTNSNIDIDKAGWSFDNTYAKLPDDLLVKQAPIPVKLPKLIILNKNLSKDLDLDFTNIKVENLSQLFSGNVLPTGSESIAQAYAGHQFGHFTMLGDGRAVLMGEHLSKNGDRYDIQFKGSGKTPFSRNGDGRAALGPMLREYIISEAMHRLGVATTRSLAVVKTGESVIRETLLPGAVLTRIAASHIRVGTFQYIAATQKEENLKILFDYVINRHYPNIKNSKNQALDLLKTIMNIQINLVIDWMRIGFIHGVMNTDNVSICGETIDYGPCAFMDTYNPETVFSSIDQQGRYSFSNQPKIIKWNLARFAECIITLIDDNKDTAIKVATEAINTFEKIYEEKWLNMMRDKLGLFGEDENDQILIMELLTWMNNNKTDYTNTFCFLMNEKLSNNKIYNDKNFLIWKEKWEKRLKLNNNSQEKYLKLMHSVNPLVIPRNHKVEEALAAANKGDFEIMNKLLTILKKPYDNQDNIIDFQSSAPSNNVKYQTFCGT
ncbi:YdiU family protein [Candidatus Pelagibacter sp.]|nr:YdiU family protein [Candidatus Pelagibacter sp.]